VAAGEEGRSFRHSLRVERLRQSTQPHHARVRHLRQVGHPPRRLEVPYVREQLDERIEGRPRQRRRAEHAREGEARERLRAGGADEVELVLAAAQPDGGVQKLERARNVERRPQRLNELVFLEQRRELVLHRLKAQRGRGPHDVPLLAGRLAPRGGAVLTEPLAQVLRLADVERLALRAEPLVHAR